MANNRPKISFYRFREAYRNSRTMTELYQTLGVSQATAYHYCERWRFPYVGSGKTKLNRLKKKDQDWLRLRRAAFQTFKRTQTLEQLARHYEEKYLVAMNYNKLRRYVREFFNYWSSLNYMGDDPPLPLADPRTWLEWRFASVIFFHMSDFPSEAYEQIKPFIDNLNNLYPKEDRPKQWEKYYQKFKAYTERCQVYEASEHYNRRQDLWEARNPDKPLRPDLRQKWDTANREEH